jgi:hypothetical protein
MSECNNPTHPCANLRRNNKNGAAVIVIQNGIDILLGFERAGQYENSYNFFAGGQNPEDNGCFLETAYRELYEESGWELTFEEFINIITCQSNDQLIILPTNNGAAVFVAMLQFIDVNYLNNNIATRNANTKLPWSMREMDHVALYPLVGNPNMRVSSWVTSLLPIIKTFADNNQDCTIMNADLQANSNVDPLDSSAIINPSATVNLPDNNIITHNITRNKLHSKQISTNPINPNPINPINPNPTNPINPINPNPINPNPTNSNHTNPQKQINNIPIPNAISITINTSVPGNQILKYNPNMTIPDVDSDTIYFNPLIALNKSVIDKVPESVRVLEFFNKGLFQSLLNAHGNHKEITLETAKNNKIIDNNIQITLDMLFPPNKILYIKGEPYVIADVQWSKGNWKIDRKITDTDIKQVDINKIANPLEYNNIIKGEIISGNNQLKQLTENLIYGSNFDKIKDPSSADREIKKAAEAKKKKEEDEEKKKKEDEEEKLKMDNEAAKRKKDAEDLKKIQTNANPLLTITYPTLTNPAPQKPILTITNPAPQKPTLTITNPAPSVPVPTNLVPAPIDLIPNTPEVLENLQMSPEFKPVLTISKNSTKILRDYFLNDQFYIMVNTIFQYMEDAQKTFIQNIFKNQTHIAIKQTNNISKFAYIFTITGAKTVSISGQKRNKIFTDGLRVIENAGGGNCLFIAVADAINYYNYNNTIIDNKILHGIYGNGNNIFTQKILRTIISSNIITIFNNDPTRLQEVGQINTNNLNTLFETAIRESSSSMGVDAITRDYYNTTMMNLYSQTPNFFVTFYKNIDKSNYYRPFKLILNVDEIKEYIESNYYWADGDTISILNKALKLNIIVISKENDKISIPFPSIKSNDYNEWTKYLFLYNEDMHYELITIDFMHKVIKKDSSNKPISISDIKIKKTIFNRIDNIIPPLYIIFLIFAAFYIKLAPNDKNLVVLFTNYLLSINNSFKKINEIIQNNEADHDNCLIFMNIFDKYFGHPDMALLLGGANNTGALKSVENSDNIKISFHITIDMELQKGKTLSTKQMSNIKCIKGWNKVRKSFADFTGKKYVIPPVYDNLSDKYNKKDTKKIHEIPSMNKTKKIHETSTDINKAHESNETKKRHITGGRRRTIKRF